MDNLALHEKNVLGKYNFLISQMPIIENESGW